MNFEVLIAFIIYFALVLGVGFYFYKRSTSMEDYILGGRSMNPYVTALSAQASDMSSWLLMGLPGAVLLFGLGEAWIGIGLAIGSYLSWLLVAKKLRKHSVVAGNSLTMPEFFSNRYKDEKGYLRMISAVIILFFFVIYVASGFKGCGITLQTIFPEISVEVAMAVGAVGAVAFGQLVLVPHLHAHHRRWRIPPPQGEGVGAAGEGDGGLQHQGAVQRQCLQIQHLQVARHDGLGAVFCLGLQPYGQEGQEEE